MNDDRGITKIAQKAVETLADASEPGIIINEAIEQTESTHGAIFRGTGVKGTPREQTLWWTEIASRGDWFIEQYKYIIKYYRLIGLPEQKIYVQITAGHKWEEFLQNIIRIGTEKNGKTNGSTMTIYQVVVDESAQIKTGCTKLLKSEAEDRYPDTKNLAAGYYTVHPANEKALTRVEDYFTNLALDKDTECVVLVGKMGAKSIHISRQDADSKSNDFHAGADVNIDGINAGGGIGTAFANEWKSSTSFKVNFCGNTAINFSPDILKNSVWFKNDGQMKGLLEGLLSNNRPTKWDYSEKTYSDFSFDFNAAAKVLDVVEAEIKDEYKKTSQIYRRFHVVFPKKE